MRLMSALLVAFVMQLIDINAASAQGLLMEVAPETPKNNFYIQFGEYTPTVSTDSNVQDYYDVFYGGKVNEPYMLSLGWDWYFLRHFGLLGITTQISTWKVSGSSRICYGDTSNTEIVSCHSNNINASADGNDTTTLNIMPLSLGLVYRLDFLKRTFNFPLVPYVKGAMQYFFWSYYGGTKISRIDGEKGQGGTAGYNLTAGLSMALSWLEPGTAARGRASNDIYESYVFAEWNQIVADHFGRKKRFNMSSQQINFGLAVEIF